MSLSWEILVTYSPMLIALAYVSSTVHRGFTNPEEVKNLLKLGGTIFIFGKKTFPT